MSTESASTDYFNNLSQRPSSDAQFGFRPSNERTASYGTGKDGEMPKQKRIACVLCRKRKLKCDGIKPSCSTCARLRHGCTYDEARKKSGPKRGYVKLLEARLAQVETLLHTQTSSESSKHSTDTTPPGPVDPALSELDLSMGFEQPNFGSYHEDNLPGQQQQQFAGSHSNTSPLQSGSRISMGTPLLDPSPAAGLDDMSWEMIGLGLEEPLPNRDIMEELNQIYFDKIHPSMPAIHRPRFMAALDLAPHMRPPACLRYAMWCSAASVSEKYKSCQQHFYERARKYAQLDEMKSFGEATITVSHAQCWVLIGAYEFKMMHYPRAWLSVGRAARLAQMMGLQRMDGPSIDVKQCIPLPRDWTEREERRRTFWMVFVEDRYASVGTGWPMMIEETDIMTYLPASEEAYLRGQPVETMSLKDAFDPAGAPSLSCFAAVVAMASVMGRNLTHIHRPGPDDQIEDLTGQFWKRHRALDKILCDISLGLPDHLRIPSGLPDPNVPFLNMSIHASTICLHQAAIFKAEKHRLPANIAMESKLRCLNAAAATTSVMKSISHLDLGMMSPFLSFLLYVAARVFFQYLKARPADEQAQSSLQFLLSAMQALKRKHPITESFLLQLEVDLEGLGLSSGTRSSGARSSDTSLTNPKAFGICGALAKIKEIEVRPVSWPSTFEDCLLPIHTKDSSIDPKRTADPTNGCNAAELLFPPPSNMSNQPESTTYPYRISSATTTPNLESEQKPEPFTRYGIAFFGDRDMDMSGGSSNEQGTSRTISSSEKGSGSYTSHSSPGRANANPQRVSQSPLEEVGGQTLAHESFFPTNSFGDFQAMGGSIYPPTPGIDFLTQSSAWGVGGTGLTTDNHGAAASLDNNTWLGMMNDAGSWPGPFADGGGQ